MAKINITKKDQRISISPMLRYESNECALYSKIVMSVVLRNKCYLDGDKCGTNTEQQHMYVL